MNGRSRPKAASQSLSADQDLKPTVGHAGDDAGNDAPAQPMTKADRANLERLARKRARVTKTKVGERVKVLRFEVEDQLSATYTFDDAVWVDLTRHAQAEVAKTDAALAKRCRELGIPENLRPRLTLGWYERGESGSAKRRVELRKLAYAHIDAAAESAKVVIEENLLDVETELIRDGLESAEAVAYLDSMPTPEQLMPQVNVGELESGQPKGRSGGWEPPLEAAGELLTPSSATSREAKRQAIAAALAANPERSDREIGRLVDVDHKTVGKWRGEGGEIPSESGEIPSGDKAGEDG
jgi:hypothetical protein